MAFWKRRKSAKQPRHPMASHDEELNSIRREIDDKESDDPLIRLKITGQDITANLLEMTRDSKGVNMENAMGILGALAGFSTSYAMMTKVVAGKLDVEAPEVVIATLKSGGHVMFGDFINRKLIEGEEFAGQTLSLLHVVYGKAQHLDTVDPLDVDELFARVARTVGTPEFGIPQMPASHMPGDSLKKFVTYLFPKFRPILERYDLPPDHYHLAFGMSAQEVMEMGKDVLSPGLSAKLFMECAVPMSSLDPGPIMTKRKK
jgi:hypothetical protein